MLDPDMSTEALAFRLGPMTLREMDVARKAIQWANSQHESVTAEIKLRELLCQRLDINHKIRVLQKYQTAKREEGLST